MRWWWLLLLLTCGAAFAAPVEIQYSPDCKLDLYRPATSKAVPLVVLVHGGSWSEGDKRNFVSPELLAQGIAVASVNYRLQQFPAMIEDVKAAIRFLRSHAAE